MPLSPEEKFQNFLFKRSHYLAQLENGALQGMVEPYKRAKKEIKKKINYMIENSQGISKEWRIARLQSQLAEADGILRAASLSASDDLFSTMAQLTSLDSDTYAQMLNSQFGKIGVDISRIPMRQVDFILNNNLRGVDLASKLSTMNQNFLDFVKGELTQSIIQGEDMARATKRLMPDTAGLTSPIERRMKNRMEMIARTEIQYVSNSVARETYKENQDVLKGMQWSAALDPRTCLLGNTLVDIDNNKKKIKDINVGDLVLTHKGRYKKVIDKNTQKRNKYLKVRLSNGKTIKVTEDHEVLTKYGWKEIGKLQKGDSISGFKEEVEILSIEEIKEEVDVYDITVEEDRSFIAEGIVVHNCPQCASMDGRVFKFKDGENNAPLLPIHPFCFIDPNVLINTIGGVKPIIEIEEGDLVLTHKGRYRKVTELIRHRARNNCIVTIEAIEFNNCIGNIKKLSLTYNHPVFVNGNWTEADKVDIGDSIKCLFGLIYDGEKTKIAFTDINVCRIKKEIVHEEKMLYNFSVEEDESYVVEGFVVHNCRCVYIPITKSWKELGAKIPPEKIGQAKVFTGNPLKGQLTYNNWLRGQPIADQKEILGTARYNLWKSGDIKLNQMATQDGILRNVYIDKPGALSLESLTQKQLKGLGVEVVGPKPSAQLSAEVRAQMTQRQLAAIDNYVPTNKTEQSIAELAERQLAKDIGGDHVIGNLPFDVFRGNEFIEHKTLISGSGKISMKADAIKRKTDYINKYKVRGHTVITDRRPGSETFGKRFYRKGFGEFRTQTMTEVRDNNHLIELLSKGARKTDHNPIASAKVPKFKTIKEAENWLKKQLDLDNIKFNDVPDIEAAQLINKYIMGSVDILDVKPTQIYILPLEYSSKNIPAVATEKGELLISGSFFNTTKKIKDTIYDNFNIGHFGTDSKGHILRHEFGHLQYFKKGGTEALAGKELTPKMIKDLQKGIGEANLPKHVSKYARKNQGEFYAEMWAKVLNGEQLHPVVKKIMKDIEKGIKKGVVGKAKKGNK